MCMCVCVQTNKSIIFFIWEHITKFQPSSSEVCADHTLILPLKVSNPLSLSAIFFLAAPSMCVNSAWGPGTYYGDYSQLFVGYPHFNIITYGHSRSQRSQNRV